MRGIFMVRQWLVGMVLVVALLSEQSAPRAEDTPATDVASFLVLREIDQPRRAVLETATEWTAEADAALVKILQRLDAPANLVAGWRAAAKPVPAAGEAVTIADVFLGMRGRAIFVAPRLLPSELAERLGRPGYDIVRLVDDRGMVLDVITPQAPREWPRWQLFDEPAGGIGLPLSKAAFPQPGAPPTDATAWPEDRPAVVVAAANVAWYPDTPLGRAGMDYGLFDAVEDGKKLVRGDTAAFYEALAAAGRSESKVIAVAAGGPTDPLPLIDPGQKWLPKHRGDAVVIEGTALRATRVPIDDPFRQEQVGRDHYWELFVFVETPLLDVDGRVQNSYPIVCCVLDLSPEMPRGERINEPVRVPGYAFKRYAYSFESPREEDGDLVAETERRQTTLVIAPRAIWSPAPPDAASQKITIIAGIAAVVTLAAIFGLGLLYGSWSMNRTIKRSREELPDRVQIDDAGDDAR